MTGLDQKGGAQADVGEPVKHKVATVLTKVLKKKYQRCGKKRIKKLKRGKPSLGERNKNSRVHQSLGKNRGGGVQNEKEAQARRDRCWGCSKHHSCMLKRKVPAKFGKRF